MTQPITPVIIALLALSCPISGFAETATPVDVRILAINDLHGNLRPPSGGIRIADPNDKARKIAVPAGGVETMATLVQQLRQGHGNTIFVAAGDLIGASPFLSAMFHDEPTIESLSMMGLEVASVGNHEFDEGKDELLRMQNGGCHPTDKCQGPHPFAGARVSLPCRQHHRQGYRQDPVPALRDQGVRRHSGRLHRPDAEGHTRDHLAGQRGGTRIPR
jgi:5'-nucleotidase